MANGGRIQYTVGFNSDVSGLNRATQEIQKIQESLKAVKTINIGIATAGKAPEEIQKITRDLTEAQSAAKLVGSALQRSFSTKLNAVNVTSFNNELKKSGTNITEIGQKLSKAGVEGQSAFRNITAQIAKSKVEVKQTNKLLNEMKDTMLNSVKWGITSSIWNNMTGSIEKAWGFAKKLDSSLNDIRIVTDKSAQDMEKFAVQANKAAKNLGASTTGYTDASLIYYQQGLSDAEVQARTETTLKAANVTGQSAAEVSEQLTAVWNGYKVSAQEAELYIDKLSAVAASTAADLEELSTGMSKVASAANIMGVDIDQLNAQLATVVSVTRQAPESVGTAFKTIYARMGDIEAGLDTETSLGEYTKRMSEMGFNVLDTNGKLKDMGSVIEEIGNKWTDLSREQQVALSQTMAGTRQYNNLLALFDNWDEYTKSLETSRNAAGSLQRQQDIYMESTEAHLQQLATEGERVYNSLFDSKQINPMIDGLTTLVSLIADAISGFGGMGPILLSLGSIFTRVFSKQIASSITTTIVNMRNAKKNTIELQEGIATLRKAGEGTTDEATKQISNMGQNIKDLALKGLVSQEQVDQLQTYIDKLADLAKAQGEIEQQQKNYQESLKLASEQMEQSGIGESSANMQKFAEIEQAAEKDKTDYSKIKEDELEEKLQKNNKAYGELSERLEKQRKDLEKAAEAAQDYANKLSEAADKGNQLAGKDHKTSEEKKALKETNKTLKKETDNLIQEIRSGGQFTEALLGRDDIAKAIKEYEGSLAESSGKVTPEVRKNAEALASAYQSALEEMSNNIDEIQATARDAALGRSAQMSEELDSIINSEKKTVEECQEEVNDINFEKHISTITNLVGSIQSLASGVWGVVNAFSVWRNEDLTFVEKLTQTISGLAIALPMAISGVSGFISGINTMKTQLPELIIMIKAKAAAIDKETATTAANTAAEAANAATNLTNAGSNVVDAEAHDLAERETREETEATNENTVSEATNTGANLTNAGSNAVDGTTGGASTKGLGKALGKVIGKGLSKAGPALAVAAGIAVTVAAVAVAINIANAAYNEAQENAEKASKAAQELRDNYSQVKDETEALKASFDKYVETKKAIEELTVGTQEWKDAIREANIEVSDLISKYPELAKYVSNGNGQLEISEEGRTALLAQQKEAENEAYEASQTANIANLQAQSDLEVAKTVKDTEGWNEVGWAAAMGGGAASGAIAGGITGFGIPIPVLGNIIGAVAGGILGAGAGALGSVLREITSDVSSKEVGAVAEAYSKYGEQILDGAGSIKYFVEEATGIKLNDAQAELLASNTDALRELCVAVDNNTTAQELQEQQVLSSAFEGNAIFDSSEVKDGIIKILQDDVFEPTGKYYQAAEESVKKMSDDELMDAYAKKMNFNVDSSKKDDEGNYVFNLSDGTTRTIEQATVQSALLTDKAIELAGDAIATIDKQLTGVYQGAQNVYADPNQGGDGKSYNVGDTLLKFAGGEGSLMDATGDELYGLLQYIEQLKAGPEEELEKVAQQLGYESGEAFLKEYQRAANEQYTAERDLWTKLYKHDTYYDNKGTDNNYLNEMSLEQQQNTINLLNEAQRRLGDAGFEYFDELFAKNAQNAEEMSKLFAEVDWTSEESVENLKNNLDKLGVSIDYNDEGWSNFVASMQKSAEMFNPTITKLTEIRDTLAEIDKITKDLEIGSIISDEDYQTLLKTNPELEKYFMLTNEGYKYVGTGKIGESLSNFVKSDLIVGEGTLEKTKTEAKKVAETIAGWGTIPTDFTPEANSGKTETDLRKEYLSGLDEETKKYLGINGKTYIDDAGKKLSVDVISMMSEEEILDVFDKMNEAVGNYNNGLYETQKVEELWVSNNVKNVTELNKLFKSGAISADTYSKARISLLYEEAQAMGVSVDEYEQYIQYLQTSRGLSLEAAAEQAKLALAQEKAVNDLVSNWETWKISLTEVNPNEHEYEEAISGIQEAFKGILDEDLSKDFIEDNLSLFDDLANGVEGSFEAIQIAIAKYFGKAVIEEQKLTGEAKTDFSNFIDSLSAEAATMEFGDTLSDDLSSALSTMLQNTEYWSDDMYAILKALGLSFTELMNYEVALKDFGEGKYDKMLQLANDLELSSYQEYNWSISAAGYSNSSDADKAANIASFLKAHPEIITNSIVKVSDPGSKNTTDKDGGGKTSSEPSKKDYLEEDRDRYHDINVEIKKLANNLEDLKTAEEHLTGKDLINNLNQQLKILDKTVARQREKLKIQKQEQKELQAQLKSQGVQFDKDGTIANYNAILDSKMKDVNKAIATYNSFKTKEEQEAYEETLEAIEKDYEDFKEKIESYEELVYDDMQDLEQEIADNISEQISLKIQAFEVTVQIELDYTEALKSFNDFKKEMYLAESDIFGKSNIDLENLKLGYEDLETNNYNLRYLMQEYEKGKKGDESSIFVVDGEFDEATALEKIREANKEVQDSLLNVNQLTNSILRSYLDAMDQAQEKIETQISHHEFINDLLNHGLKLTQLINGENDYTEMAKYYDDIVENDNKQIEKMAYAKNFWAKEMESAKQALAEAANDQEKEIAQERYDKAVENWKNATNELNSYVETAVENLQAKYENAIDKILQDMTNSFTDGKSLDYISKEWELINDNADRYLDTVNSTYEVQSLEAKYMNAIDSTDSISAQKKLNKAMEEELAALREKDKLTQYDIDRANKKLDITMKQIALEEAQANKSTMRLRRDAQGNYSYQFVADEDEIAKAQQDLLAAQNDLYNFDKEAYEKNLDEAYQAYVQFQEDLKKAAMINDPKERAAYETLIREQYEQKITDLTAINETIRGNLQNSAFEALSGMYNTNEENFKLMNDDILADFSTLTIEDMPNLMGQLVEGWNTSIQQMITSFAGEEGFIPKCEAAYEALKVAHGNYETELKNLKNSAGIFDDIYSDISDDITKTDDFTLSTSQLSATIGTDLTSAWANLKTQLDFVLQAYKDIKIAAEDAVEAANKLNEDYYEDNSVIGEDKNDDEKIPLPGEDDKDSKKKKKKKKTDSPSDPTAPENPKSDEEKEKGKMPSPDIMKGVAACIWYGVGAGGWETNPGRKKKLTEKFTEEGQQRIQGLINNKGDSLLNWARKNGGDNYNQWLADNYSYSKFDTGGYTGEWGAEGRMAMLHEKEIVLNKQDTANILSAVSIVRGIGDLINNLSANLLGSLSQRAIDSTLGMRDFEQNVHITAEFPNVSSSSEIEDALRNLTNVAAQRAFNTRI